MRKYATLALDYSCNAVPRSANIMHADPPCRRVQKDGNRAYSKTKFLLQKDGNFLCA